MPISPIKRAGPSNPGATANPPLVRRASATPGASEPSTGIRKERTEVLLVSGLALVALVPRIILAFRLDLVTDEVVYITAGKLYISLLRRLDFLDAAWFYNYEHPPFVKLLIGLSISLNALIGHPLAELQAARLPSIVCGTLLILAIYWLGREPFGRIPALFAALCLALSPWLVYFSALAYLDMTTTMLITVAFLLLWPALRQPRIYLLIALLVGLALASKYTASLLIPGMLIYVGYHTLFLRPQLLGPPRSRPPLLWWCAACIITPVAFLLVDPTIWSHPFTLLLHSLRFEWAHSAHGHLTFVAGYAILHVPEWTVLYVLLVKVSIFTTIPTGCFLLLSLLKLARFHLRAPGMPSGSSEEACRAASNSFLLVWLVSALGMFSLLNIAVGTHYFLPVAPPLALAGAVGFGQGAHLLKVASTKLRAGSRATLPLLQHEPLVSEPTVYERIRTQVPIVLLALFLVVPHASGLVTVYGEEGYTSELFHGEDAALQVAYPGYRDAVEWLAGHTDRPARIGLVALSNTLENSGSTVSWFHYNGNLPKRFKLTEVHPGDYNFPYDYLIWPMHLQQRGYAIPAQWRQHIVDTITGGNTIYCYILARDPATIAIYKDEFVT